MEIGIFDVICVRRVKDGVVVDNESMTEKCGNWMLFPKADPELQLWH